jgi:hypothetical protein
MKEKLIEYLKDFLIESEGWEDGNIKEQARSIFTTICLIGNIDADIAECDHLLAILYDEYIMPFKEYYDSADYEEFKKFMLEPIV